MRILHWNLATWLITLVSVGLPAQNRLAWPADREQTIARVQGTALTFEDLVDHMTARHDPHFASFLATPGGRRCFTQQSLGAEWVRQYADVVALMTEAKKRKLDPSAAEPALGAALKTGFEAWLTNQNLPEQPTQELIDFQLARYQRYFGLSREVLGWLDFLVPEEATERQLRVYYGGHPRIFGGTVTFAHILVRHRHAHTLELLSDDGRAEAWKKVADLRSRLKDDASNFEELAERYSDDSRTGTRGGVFENVERFHPSLPASLCRAAWSLKDGGVSAPIESRYGIHLIKRISLQHRKFFLFTQSAHPEVRRVRRMHLREDLLFGLREQLPVRLDY